MPLDRNKRNYRIKVNKPNTLWVYLCVWKWKCHLQRFLLQMKLPSSTSGVAVAVAVAVIVIVYKSFCLSWKVLERKFIFTLVFH